LRGFKKGKNNMDDLINNKDTCIRLPVIAASPMLLAILKTLQT
jgi:hypothetical protein